MSNKAVNFETEDLQEYAQYLISWIQTSVQKANKKGVIVGISGGVDSALVGALAKSAFPNNALALILEINSLKASEEHLKAYFKAINLDFQRYHLDQIYQSFLTKLKLQKELAKVNMQPRLRMIALYAWAQEKDYLVLGTDNWDEWHIGYFTKHGDGAADLAPIIHLTKTEVRQMARLFKVPEIIVNKTPSADLWENQSDEEELGISYQSIDNYLKKIPIALEDEIKIAKMHHHSEHKRNLALKPELSLEAWKLKK